MELLRDGCSVLREPRQTGAQRTRVRLARRRNKLRIRVWMKWQFNLEFDRFPGGGES